MQYEETPIEPTQAVKKLTTKKSIIKKETTDVNKEAYKKAKADHNAEIAKLKQDISKHKLLKKQAKIVYKLSTFKGAK